MIKIKDLFFKYREIILYLFFGGCTTFVNIAVYMICSAVGMSTAAGTSVAWVLSVLFAYVTNRLFVFKDRARTAFLIFKEASSFFLCRVATGILDLFIMVIFVDILNKNELIIKILSNALVIILNYAASKMIIFNKKDDVSSNGRNFFEKTPDYLRFLFCLYIAASLFLNIFVDKSFNTYYPPNNVPISNLKLFIPILILFVGVISVVVLFKRKTSYIVKQHILDKYFYLIIVFLFVFVFFIQLFISDHIYFRTGWDVSCLIGTAEHLAFNRLENIDDYTLHYFSTYPNNLTMLYSLVPLFKIGNIVIPSNPYVFIVAFTNFCVSLSVCLSVLCIYKLTKDRIVTILGMFTGIFLIALSPWIVIPYTDSIGMVFPVMAIFCYLFIRNEILRYSLISFFCVFGYYYKPTVLIIFIALIIIKSCSVISRLVKRSFSLKKTFFCMFSLLIGIMVAFGLNKIILMQNSLVLNPDKEKTMTHYFMMGLNTETEGCYNSHDVAFSDSFPDVSSRQNANIRESVKRLKNLGIGGYSKQLLRKNLLTYNNGTFGFGREGHFYREIPKENSDLDHMLRDIFYESGKNNKYLITAEQILWLLVLFLICFCFIRGHGDSDGKNLIALSLLGVSLFLLLFECRARYLFIFSPLFVILAFSGLNNVGDLLLKVISSVKLKRSEKKIDNLEKIPQED